MSIDRSTLNMERLHKCKVYEKPPTYTLSQPGSGCLMDPPGHTSYFLQSVYNRHGNVPSNAPEYVIDDGLQLRIIQSWPQGDSNRAYSANRETALLRFYIHPPYESERVQLWIASVFQHFKHCYYDADADGTDDEMLIYPVPYYKLKKTHIDDRWRDDVIAAYQAADDAANRAVLEHAEAVAIPENHKAHRLVKRFYPEHTLEKSIEYIANPPQYRQEDWWHLEGERPSVEECSEYAPWLHQGWRHPKQPGMHCLRCGRDT